jgi:methionyl aminopeptidase
MNIIIKNDDAIKKIAIAGNIIYEVFAKIEMMNLQGMKTIELNNTIDGLIRKHNATPAFLNYRGFPKSCCISLNNEVVHGIPDDRGIKDGDLVKVDVGVTYQGYVADAAKSFAVGAIDEGTKKLLAVTKDALKKGISMAKTGNKISDISRTIQKVVEENGYGVVRELTGHGVGHDLHEEPMIPNFVTSGTSPTIQRGMVLAIEPMVTMGDYRVVTATNGWTISTRDGSLSCHFEDTIAVLEKGNLNLTRVAGS